MSDHAALLLRKQLRGAPLYRLNAIGVSTVGQPQVVMSGPWHGLSLPLWHSYLHGIAVLL